LDCRFDVFNLPFYFVLDFLRCVIFSDDGMFLVQESRYVGLVLFEGLDLFSFGGIVFPTAGDTIGGGGFILPTTASDS